MDNFATVHCGFSEKASRPLKQVRQKLDQNLDWTRVTLLWFNAIFQDSGVQFWRGVGRVSTPIVCYGSIKLFKDTCYIWLVDPSRSTSQGYHFVKMVAYILNIFNIFYIFHYSRKSTEKNQANQQFTFPQFLGVGGQPWTYTVCILS